MDAQFDHTVANRLTITEVTGLDLAQANPDACLGDFIAHGAKPLREGFASIVTLMPEKFDHMQLIVAYKLL